MMSSYPILKLSVQMGPHEHIISAVIVMFLSSIVHGKIGQMMIGLKKSHSQRRIMKYVHVQLTTLSCGTTNLMHHGRATLGMIDNKLALFPAQSVLRLSSEFRLCNCQCSFEDADVEPKPTFKPNITFS